MDASIMEGDRLQCGAVAAVPRIANPITLARRVLEARRHVLLVGDGALAFARSVGVPECDAASLVTARQQRRHAEVAPRRATPGGTVGAVALDRSGTIAAATSTGGTIGKLPGRVGDSALIGCGTYAESSIGGGSCTRDREAIIRGGRGHPALCFLRDALPLLTDALRDQRCALLRQAREPPDVRLVQGARRRQSAPAARPRRAGDGRRGRQRR